MSLPDTATSGATPKTTKQTSLFKTWTWPATWFKMCESAFAVRQIMSSVTKYHHCMGKLPTETVATVEDMVNNYATYADPYTELKVYSRTEMQNVNGFWTFPLGAEKP